MLTALTALVGTLLGAGPAATAQEAPEATGPEVIEQRVTVSDGVELQTTLTTHAAGESRPTLVEFSPYGRGSQTLQVPDDYNYLLVQIRGTGDSDGRFDALGPKSQSDVVDVLDWACAQDFSGGDLALTGFSASAIVLYNSWHTELPCVRAAVLRSGTHELYRDLLVPGGIVNLLPGVGVLAMIGAPAFLQGPDRLARNPLSAVDILLGLVDSGLNAGVLQPLLGSWWKQRGWRGNGNDIPVMMINGFFDVESRGAFQGFQALEEDGAHLRMFGGHDGQPVGTDGGAAEAVRWLDHHVRGIDNGITREPRVQLMMSNGSREGYLAGDYTSYAGESWPVPGTEWVELNFDAARSGSAKTINDGSLSLQRPNKVARSSYLTIPSIPTMTDLPTTALLGAGGLDQAAQFMPFLTNMDLAEKLGLTWTTPPLSQDVLAAGPLSVELPLSTTTESGIWVVLSDVAPDGTASPLTVGRLSTAFPKVDEERSLTDDQGRIVQPYPVHSHKTNTPLLREQRYQVEMWPVGNRFRAGHRIRVHLVGTSAASMPALPALHTVRVGGPSGARILFPVLPGSDLPDALR